MLTLWFALSLISAACYAETNGSMDKLVCIDDFHKVAVKMIDPNSLEYFESGADDEYAIKENRDSFQRWIIRPRILRDISKRDTTSAPILRGKSVALPIGITPMGLQKLAHPDGELALARAADKMGTIFVLSTMATSSIEDVAAAAPKARKWFQLYIQKDREVTRNHVQRAENASYEAIVLTVDSQVVGNRRVNLRNPIYMPSHLGLANFLSKDGDDTMSKSEKLASARNNSFPTRDYTMSWSIIKWLRKETKLPIVIKGILTPEDADLAVQHGADAIVVSNHGGRQLDCTSPPLMVLESIVNQVKGQCDVYVDGGITKGSDVFKALALGAKMVFVGRSMIWGLAVGGEEGATKVLQILKDELDQTMGLAGIVKIDEITRKTVGRYKRF